MSGMHTSALSSSRPPMWPTQRPTWHPALHIDRSGGADHGQQQPDNLREQAWLWDLATTRPTQGRREGSEQKYG